MVDTLSNDPVIDKVAIYGQHSSGETRAAMVYDEHIGTTDYLTSIGIGKIAGHIQFGGFGQRSA